MEHEGVASRGRFDVMRQGCIGDIDKEGWGEESDSIVVIVGMGEEIWATREGIGAC